MIVIGIYMDPDPNLWIIYDYLSYGHWSCPSLDRERKCPLHSIMPNDGIKIITDHPPIIIRIYTIH